MTDWKTFNPKREAFKTQEDYNEYRNTVRCAICHQMLQPGDEFDMRSVQTPEQTGSLTVIAVICHRKCLNED